MELKPEATGSSLFAPDPNLTADAKVEEEIQKPELDEEGTPVKYSRFRNVNQRRIEAEKEAEYWRQEAQRRESQVAEPESDIPSSWKKLYGDSDDSKEAWKIQQQMYEDLKRDAIEEARNAVRTERQAESERVESNLEVLDEGMEGLEDFVGRRITSAEESALLDIVDEYTPKDRDGNYAGDIIPLEKAWNILELQKNAQKAPSRESRNSIASLTNNQTYGQANDKDKDKSFDGSWGSFRNPFN